jgi:hypothetical protein
MAPHPFYRSSSGSNMLPKSVHRTYSGTQVLHRTSSSLQEITEATEVSDNDENENFKHDLDLALDFYFPLPLPILIVFSLAILV